MTQYSETKDFLNKLQQTSPVSFLLAWFRLEETARALFLSNDASPEMIDRLPAQEQSLYRSIAQKLQEIPVGEHLPNVTKTLEQFENLHQTLSKDQGNSVYQGLYLLALPHLVMLRSKAGGNPKGEVETALIGIYGATLIKQRGETLSDETSQAISKLTNWLTYLEELLLTTSDL